MTIEEKIKEISSRACPDMSFVFGTMYEIDRKTDFTSPPFIWAVFPEVGSLDVHRGRFKERLRLLIGFCDLVHRDAESDDNMACYRRMVERAKEWIRHYNADGFFEPIDGRVETNLFAEVNAANVTGLFLDINVIEAVGSC